MSDDLHPGEIEHRSVTTAVTTVTLAGDHRAVEILKRTSAGELWATVDSATDPVVDADGAFCLPEGINSIRIPSPSGAATVVKLTASAGTIKASVTGLRP